MRIGIVTGEYYPDRGGVGDYSRELAFALGRQGQEVHLITPITSTRDPHALWPPSCVLHPVIQRWSIVGLLALRRLARRLHLDVLDLQYQALAYGMRLPIHLLPRVAGVPVVVTFHDLRVPYLFPKAGALRRAVLMGLARSACGVIVTNAEDENALRSSGNPGRLVQIPIGSNFRVAPPVGYERAMWRAQMGIGPQEFLVGFFGFLNREKGGDILLAAMKRLVDQGWPVRLALIGGKGNESSQLLTTEPQFADSNPYPVSMTPPKIHQVLAELDMGAGLGERALITGYLEPSRVSAWLLACDVLALPYTSGVSLRSGSLMAGLVHGCPIVVTEPLNPLSELEDGENVRLVPRGDPLATAAALAELLASARLRKTLSDGARRLARRFDWDGIARQTGVFLEETLRREIK